MRPTSLPRSRRRGENRKVSPTEPVPMPIDWTDDLARIDWCELSALYRAAPLGDKAPADLELVFGNSMFRAFAFDGGALVGAGRVLAGSWPTAVIAPMSAILQCSHRIRGWGWGGRSSRDLCASPRGTRRSFFTQYRARKALYRRFGFRRMRTAMAIFADPASAVARGYLDT